MSALTGKQTELEKKAEAFGNTWPGRIVAGVLLLVLVWIAFSLFSDFSTNVTYIAEGITFAVLFIGLEIVKKLRR